MVFCRGADLRREPVVICPACDGEGWLLTEVSEEWIPCDQCGGCGLAYCCEGAPAKPEVGDAAQD